MYNDNVVNNSYVDPGKFSGTNNVKKETILFLEVCRNVGVTKEVLQILGEGVGFRILSLARLMKY